MKIIRIIALFLILTTFLTGCDAIRSALGKPTSKDIAALRAQKAQMQRTGDSLAVAMGAAPDSVEAAEVSDADSVNDSVAVAEVSAPAAQAWKQQEPLSPDAGSPEDDTQDEVTGSSHDAGLTPGYYVVLGSFKNADNARYYYNSLSASGAEVHLVRMKNGFTAVMICHGATYDESYAKMQDFYRDKKKPEDIWIYNTAKKMHIE